MRIFEQKYTISTQDVDKNLNIKPSGILRILQEAAALHSESVISIYNKQDTKIVWILISWKVKILRTPKWSEELIVRTWPRKTDLMHCYRDFEICDNTGEKVIIATSKWVLFDIEKNKLQKIEEEFKDKYILTDKAVFGDEEIEKLKPVADGKVTFEYNILRRDIDSNNHVNNTNYLDFAIEALPEDIYEKLQVSSIEVLYKKECRVSDHICCEYKQDGDKQCITVKNVDLSTVYAIIELK